MTDKSTDTPSQDYKDTLNLADTPFAMRANLAKREPDWLAAWEADDVYGKIRQARAGATKYILHDGLHTPTVRFTWVTQSIKY